MNYSIASSTVVIDASAAIRAIWPIASNSMVLERVENWHREKVELIAPEIWRPEVISVIRQGVYRKAITTEEARRAIENIFALGVEVIPANKRICQSALLWAERLGHSKAYDSFYLALAAAKQAEFWTADKRLVRGAKQIGVSWIYSIT